MDPGQIEVVDEAVAEALRKKTPSERLAMVFDANRTVRQLLESTLRSRHPAWDDRRVRQEIARRMLSGTD